jgi:predicted regulator of Ras-like GTPase activity (Roadblock/LC7/MglB family)
MDAAQALADLTEISSQIEAAALIDEDGALLGATLDDADRAQRLGEGGNGLLEAARTADTGRDGASLAQVEAAMSEGSVFVVCEGGRAIVATTAPDPTAGLVLYDLKSCLRSLDAAAAGEQRKPRRAKKKPEERDGAA